MSDNKTPMPDKKPPMQNNKTPPPQRGVGGSVKSESSKKPPNAQLAMTEQFLHLLRLLLRVKLYRGIFLFLTVLLMHYNLITGLISTFRTKEKKEDISRDDASNSLKFYSMSDFASSSAKVLIDRSAFPVESDAAAAIVSAKGGSTSWMEDCSPESACRAQFIGESDPSLVAYFRYSKNNETRRHILECFWVKNSDLRCAILYQLMVQSIYGKKSNNFFKDVQLFTLEGAMEEESFKEESKKVNRTPKSEGSICANWVEKNSYSDILTTPLALMTIGLTFYFLITTISFIRIIKMGGFYKQLIRNGLSVTCYWTAIWLTTFSECIIFALLFVLSHVLPCLGVFSLGGITRVFVMLSVFFIELASVALLLEILVPSVVAVSILLLTLGVALNIAFVLYKRILQDFAVLGSILPPIHIKEYIETYMTSGASTGEFSTPPVIEHDSYRSMLTTNIVTAAVVILTTTYIDFLLPSGNGLCLLPNFIFIPRFWRSAETVHGNKQIIDGGKGAASDEKSEPHIEPVVGFAPSITVDKVSKTYKCCLCSDQGIQVLQQLSCKIYKNQITALIGHNGAGKSTLIRILTGEENPDSGTAHIGGIEVTDPIERLALRGSISVCPQFNLLCEALSVIECIQITLTSKGISGHRELERARSLLKRLGLGDKENVISTDLSGGQKRKVNTILALLGDPKVVFLDEPTSGLDPVSRRQLWQLLQEQKLGRSIVLCTQFMDEADILADRKIFLCGGNIVCAGSSMFLKRAFGCSFTITVSLKSEGDAQKLLSRLKEVQLKSQFKTELQLEIPASKPNVLIAAVAALEDASEIEAFGLSQANLDDVFMRLSGISSTDVIDAFRSGNLSKLQDKPNSDAMEKGKIDLSQLMTQPVKVAPSGFVQFLAMLRVNLKKQWRTTSTFWSRYVVSAFLMLVLVLSTIIGIVSEGREYESMEKDGTETVTVDYLNNLQVDAVGTANHIKTGFTGSLRSSEYSEAKGLNVVCIHDEDLSLEALNQSCDSLSLFGKDKPQIAKTVSATSISKPKDENLRSFLLKKSTREELHQRCRGDDEHCFSEHCKSCIVYYASTWSMDELNSQREIAIGLFIGDTRNAESTVHAYRRALNKIWYYFGAADVDDATALANIKPFSQASSRDTFLLTLVFVFCLFPLSYLNDPIEDITSRVRNQLLSMGMSYLAYWINLFSLHWVQYSVCFIISVGIVFIWDSYRHWGYAVYAILPVLLFGTTSNLLSVYIVANATRTANTIVILLLNMVVIVLPGIVLLYAFNARVTLTLITLVPPMAPIASIFYGLLPAQYAQEYYLADRIGDTPGAFDNYWNHSYVLRPVIMIHLGTVRIPTDTATHPLGLVLAKATN